MAIKWNFPDAFFVRIRAIKMVSGARAEKLFACSGKEPLKCNTIVAKMSIITRNGQAGDRGPGE